MSGCINSFLIGQDPPYPASGSCINAINTDTPATCVVVATADELLGTVDSYALADDLKALGVESPVYVAEGMVSLVE